MSAPTAYVRTSDIIDAVKGREDRVLDALGIAWKPNGRPISAAPIPTTAGTTTGAGMATRGRAFCTCSKPHSIFDVLMKFEGVDFETAKIRVAETIGRAGPDPQAGQRQALPGTDPDSLSTPRRTTATTGLSPPISRTGLASTRPLSPCRRRRVAGLKALTYFDPPQGGREADPRRRVPCAVFGTVAADGKRHAHRIYVAPGGAGKADLPRAGRQRARPEEAAPGQRGRQHRRALRPVGRSRRRAVDHRWRGDRDRRSRCLRLQAGDRAGELAVAAAITAGGVEAFQPYPATKRITVAADRDEEAKPRQGGRRHGGVRRRRAAFGLRHP